MGLRLTCHVGQRVEAVSLGDLGSGSARMACQAHREHRRSVGPVGPIFLGGGSTRFGKGSKAWKISIRAILTYW